MSKRDKAAYPGLNKSVNLKIRHEVMDQDYIHLLSDKEKKWLSDFMRETVGADFSHPGKKLYRSKAKRKAIYDANNARNRDAFSVCKSNDMLKAVKPTQDYVGSRDKKSYFNHNSSTNLHEVEDTLIAVIDQHNSKKLK